MKITSDMIQGCQTLSKEEEDFVLKWDRNPKDPDFVLNEEQFKSKELWMQREVRPGDFDDRV